MSFDLWRKIYYKISKRVLGINSIRHKEPSLIFSLDGVLPNNFLIELVLGAISKAWSESVLVSDPSLDDAIFLNEFPGEHYRILKAITGIISPRVAIEIGTYTGMGSLAIMQGQSNGCLYTFDIISWNLFSSHLSNNDFEQKRVVQIIADLSIPDEFDKYFNLLNDAEIIFLDASKDGKFEFEFLKLLTRLDPKEKKLLFIDDIRFVNMIELWVSIKSPKIDITSFGHWSGTGLVDISRGLQLS